MALNVKSDRADRLARELAELTGESMTAAITVALEERLARERARRLRPDPAERLARIAREAHALPRFDERSVDEILGYALAKARGDRLLYVGNDFSHTDLAD